MDERYVELHCHSCFSLLDGASPPEALLDRAAELGMPALALTDHDGLYAVIRFSLAARQRGIAPVVGAELTLQEGPSCPGPSHLLLLAENRAGYRNLCWLISRGQLAGSKGHPRLSPEQFQGHTVGLIALTGCRQGAATAHLLAGEPKRALAALATLRELFGPHNVYVELQQHLQPGDAALVARLAHLARRARLPIIATNDVHYAQRSGSRLQDVLVAIRHNLPLSECRPHLRPNSEYYLKSPAEMATLFAAYPEALAHTLEVASRCHVDLYFRDEAAAPPDLPAVTGGKLYPSPPQGSGADRAIAFPSPPKGEGERETPHERPPENPSEAPSANPKARHGAEPPLTLTLSPKGERGPARLSAAEPAERDIPAASDADRRSYSLSPVGERGRVRGDAAPSHSRSYSPSPSKGEGDADATLAALCLAQLPARYPRDAGAAERQLRHELQVIRQTRLAGYFLLVWDVVRFAKEQGIQVRGRGSAANSIVAYLLGITAVDPLAHNLLFERFLSAEARIMPDIDLDFCSRRREEVIQYIYHKYGASHVGMVCNYITYCARSAIRDVGKALGLPAPLIDQLAKGQSKWRSHDWDPAALGFTPEDWQRFSGLCEAIQGFPRHLGIHVGGLCITRSPLDKVVPLERATMPGRVVIQWDKDNTEDAGLIKLDLLSLRTLSAIDECLQLIREARGQTIDLDALPLDDPAVYRQLQEADTIGAFQVESRAQQQALVKMRPRNLADIVVEVALIRPGPLQGNMVHPYLRRRAGLEPVRYPHPILEPILAETLGIIVFQEQVIRVAMAMGGFSAGEADLLRRAMSRHRSEEEMASFRERFVRGATARGVAPEVAEDVFTKLSGFASYGFCKSHAVAFAKTAYDTLYLRAHYPAEFYCAILNNEPMGFYAPRVVIGDARRHGVRVLPVDANRSRERCTIEEGGIRLGFLYVDGLGQAGAERVMAARPAQGYSGLPDFCRRTRLPRRLVENLILAGAMPGWGRDPRALLWELGRLHYQEEELPLPLPPDEVALEPMTHAEELLSEYSITGVSAQGHLMEIFREQLDGMGVYTSRQLQQARQGQSVRVAGLVAVRQAPPTAKGFAFITLEDETGLTNLVLTPDKVEEYRPVLDRPVLLAQGTVEREGSAVHVKARAISPLT